MIDIDTFTFNPFQVNTYIIYDETLECIIIDAACYFPKEFETIFDDISEKSLKPVGLINTHGHVDHLTGLKRICEKYSIGYSMHIADKFLLDTAEVYGNTFGFQIETPPEPEFWLNDGDFIKFGKSEMKVWHAPGHSPGSLVFYNNESKLLFSGDVLFSGSIGRTDLQGGDFDQLMNSIKTKILVLPEDTRVFPGHGTETSIGREIKQNPFLNGSY